MQKMITKSFSLLLALIMLVSCFAGFGIEAFAASSKTKKVDGVTYTYTIEKGKATVHYIAPGKKTKTVSIPSKLGGKTVTTINSYALDWDEKVKTVKIPNSVTKLCYNAFTSCYKLSEVKIGSGLKTIEKDAFPYCGSITKFTVDKKNKNFTTDNGSLYNKKKTKIIKYTTGKKTKEVKLPKSVTSIGQGAFASAAKMEKITIPSAVKTIPENAFANCEKLKTAKIPSKVTAIGDSAFYNTAIKSVTIPKSVTKMGYSTFAWCSKLTSADLSKTKLKAIPGQTFSWSEKLTSVKLPKTLTKINNGAFSGTGLKSFTASSKIEKIGYEAFNYSPNLKSVDLSKSKIKTVDSYTFQQCTKLESIKLPSTVTKISYGAFGGTNLKSFTAPKNVKQIYSEAFYCCKNLKSVDLSKTKIKEFKGYYGYTFAGCTKLETVKLPSTFTTIGEGDFSNTALKSFTASKNIKEIKASAFTGCKKLKSVDLSKSKIKTLSWGVFENCEKLESVKLPNTLKTIESYSLAGCSNLKKITIPASVESIEYYTTYDVSEVTFKGKDTSFEGASFSYIDDVVIKGKKGSAAQSCAENYGYTFVAI